MRDFHVTAEVLDRFARGDLDDRDLSEVLDHLENCETCARAGQASAANDLAVLRTEWTAEPIAARPRTSVWIFAAAAAIAIAVFSALMLPRMLPRERPAERERGRISVTPPPTKPITAESPRTGVVPEQRYTQPEWQRIVANAVESGRLSFPTDLAALRAPFDTVRGSGGSIDRVTPAAVVIEESRPIFEWPAREGGTYTVFVFDGDREVMHSSPLNVPRWTPDRALPRGRTLAWQIEVTGRGAFETIPSPPSPPAMFRIVSEADHRDLVQARKIHRDDDLLMAVLYARSGMRDEALAVLRRAAESNEAAKRILDHEISVAQ